MNLIKSDKPPTIHGDGSFSRDFTYIENVVDVNIKALTTKNKECFGEVFNIGTGEHTSLKRLVEMLKKELNVDIEPLFGPERPGDISHSIADINKAKELLNYKPKISFEEGIKKYILTVL